VHTVLLARQAPPVPVARWLARGELEVSASMRCGSTRPRGGRWPVACSRRSPSEHADALVARVEGWPAGVQLAARTLRGKADPAT
jgi:LuxR family transcriptional regulator, maltose regulon positive regulatory protein